MVSPAAGLLSTTLAVLTGSPVSLDLSCQQWLIQLAGNIFSGMSSLYQESNFINPLNPELNPICYLLALLAHHLLHVSRIRVKSLTIRLLMSYIYGAPIRDVSRSHTTTHHSR